MNTIMSNKMTNHMKRILQAQGCVMTNAPDINSSLKAAHNGTLHTSSLVKLDVNGYIAFYMRNYSIDTMKWKIDTFIDYHIKTNLAKQNTLVECLREEMVSIINNQYKNYSGEINSIGEKCIGYAYKNKEIPSFTEEELEEIDASLIVLCNKTMDIYVDKYAYRLIAIQDKADDMEVNAPTIEKALADIGITNVKVVQQKIKFDKNVIPDHLIDKVKNAPPKPHKWRDGAGVTHKPTKQQIDNWNAKWGDCAPYMKK